MRKLNNYLPNQKQNCRLTLDRVLSHKEQHQQNQNMNIPLFIEPTFSREKKIIYDSRNQTLSKLKNQIDPSLRISRVQNRANLKNQICDIARPVQISRVKSLHQTLHIQRPAQTPAKHDTSNKSAEGCQQLEELITGTTRVLIREMILFAPSSTTFTVKKEKFSDILRSLISAVIEGKRGQRGHNQGEIGSFEEGTSLISAYIQSKKNVQKIQKLALQHCVLKEGYSGQQYDSEKKVILKSLLSLTESQTELHNKINVLKQHQKSLKNECQAMQRQMDELLKQTSELRGTMEQETKQYQQLRQNSEAAEKQLAVIEQKSESLQNFVSKQENNKILKDISEEYKTIESDIYEFAVYLQANQLATQIGYEPHPFTQMQELIMEEMKAVNRTIIQNEEMPTQQKDKMMRDFVLHAMDFFKKKDTEMTNLGNFKTKCIRGFVDKMKLWLNNWELKQQFLVKLRKEFAVDSLKLEEGIEQLLKSNFCQTHIARVKDIYAKLHEYYIKIQNNYKMGNSFY